MTLLIDAGNSAIKWALAADDRELIEPQWRLHRGVVDLAARLIEGWHAIPRGTASIGCNVGGSHVAAAIEQALSALVLGSITWLQSQSRFDGPITLVNGYRDPSQLGTDRWHCMLGAVAHSSSNRSLLIVNAGTATTVDCIEASARGADARFEGRFIGGFIAPGVRLMLESLARGTAGLPAASGGADQFPDNTDAAIVSGVVDAQAGLVQQVWHRLAARVGSTPRVMLTGGNAPALRAQLSIADVTIVDNLVLRGLALRV